MLKSLKIRLLPTKEQEQMMFKTINCSRFAYNWALNRCNELYKQGEKYSINNIKKEFTQLKKQEEYKWLNDISSSVMLESINNLDKAFRNFFKNNSNYPKFKSKKKIKQSFYVRNDRLNIKNNSCNIYN